MATSRNVAWALAGLWIISILAIYFSRISLELFTLYLPFAIATGILMTIHIVPKITRLFGLEDRMFPEQIRLATHNRWEESDRASISSSLPERNIQGIIGHFPPWDVVFSHMGHLDEQDHLRRISSSMGSVSSMDPELGLGQEDASSIASVDSRAQLL